MATVEINETGEIGCPWCHFKFTGTADHYGLNGKQMECLNPTCKKTFVLKVKFEVIFTTERVLCEAHDWSVPRVRLMLSLPPRTSSQLNAENFESRSDHQPYETWERSCKVCLTEERVRVRGEWTNSPAEWNQPRLSFHPPGC